MPNDSKKKPVTDFGALDQAISHQVDLKEVPNSFRCVITDSDIHEDARGNNALYVTIAIDGITGDREKIVKQKYTGTTIAPFREALKKLGYENIPVTPDAAEGDMLVWEKKKEGRAVNDRWYPTGKVEASTV